MYSTVLDFGENHLFDFGKAVVVLVLLIVICIIFGCCIYVPIRIVVAVRVLVKKYSISISVGIEILTILGSTSQVKERLHCHYFW